MIFGKILDTLVGGSIRNIPGGLGQRIRSAYWRRRFLHCGRVKIDEGVIFQYPEQISIGNDVWIMPYALLTGPAPKNRDGETELTLIIGDEVQVGAYSILNGTGGLILGNHVTLSARVSIYSATHLPRNPKDPKMLVGCNGMVRSLPVFFKQKNIRICDGAWLGLHAVVICCNLGEQSFVASGSIVTKDLMKGMKINNDGSISSRYAIDKNYELSES